VKVESVHVECLFIYHLTIQLTIEGNIAQEVNVELKPSSGWLNGCTKRFGVVHVFIYEAK
jgi:hypothetical protein